MRKLALILSLLGAQASAYHFKAGEVWMRGLLGQVVYFAQDSSTQINTGAIEMSLEADYMFDSNWSVGGTFRPLFAPQRVVLGFGAHAKYRMVKKELPVVPYASFGVIPSFMIATNPGGKGHFNLGLRPAAGLEYFITRNLALGLEAGITPSFIFGSGTRNTMEATFDILFGATWKI
ncbi:MAG: outer membrane beta-barrel protein [Deltaproteobacteria bacterium]|nr:outer membrane beta-barrel protein [Deltaproteobacteria bacterium]